MKEILAIIRYLQQLIAEGRQDTAKMEAMRLRTMLRKAVSIMEVAEESVPRAKEGDLAEVERMVIGASRCMFRHTAHDFLVAALRKAEAVADELMYRQGEG
jgi:hypothetical protein